MSFWYNSWCSLGPIIDLVSFVEVQDIDYKVKDLWVDGLWHLDHLVWAVLLTTREAILSQDIQFNERVLNAVVWRGQLKGEYTRSKGRDG
ncbi:hypothetical protein L6164_037552 [Bauhinia variegata]|uniref:Uncharacterized protein n=1 Tax=Bauhinia variegata TaxID=167791 RepID=A0ACB9KK82_BAUVA|nr:hypothetical protein L6164_037552 [Bauhinia variegata]